jgi:hypothetical protein
MAGYPQHARLRRAHVLVEEVDGGGQERQNQNLGQRMLRSDVSGGGGVAPAARPTSLNHLTLFLKRIHRTFILRRGAAQPAIQPVRHGSLDENDAKNPAQHTNQREGQHLKPLPAQARAWMRNRPVARRQRAPWQIVVDLEHDELASL